MLTFLGTRSTIHPCTWCSLRGTEWVYEVPCDDVTGFACLACLVLVLADSSQPVSFQGRTTPWFDSLRRKLAQTPTPDSNDIVASVWTRRVGHLLRAIDDTARS